MYTCIRKFCNEVVQWDYKQQCAQQCEFERMLYVCETWNKSFVSNLGWFSWILSLNKFIEMHKKHSKRESNFEDREKSGKVID